MTHAKVSILIIDACIQILEQFSFEVSKIVFIGQLNLILELLLTTHSVHNCDFNNAYSTLIDEAKISIDGEVIATKMLSIYVTEYIRRLLAILSLSRLCQKYMLFYTTNDEFSASVAY